MTKSTKDDKILQIETLRETIADAEKTIRNAQAILLKLEGGVEKKKVSLTSDEEGVIYGNFDGQLMIGDDGKQYPVPANYASKSKLVEGDMLKLTINGGNFMYKQVGPIERKNLIGLAGQDENGNYFVISEGVPYKILLASITYFKIEPGDEVVITVPVENSSVWAAIENVLQKSTSVKNYEEKTTSLEDIYQATESEDEKEENDNDQEENNADSPGEKKGHQDLIIDEWMSDIEEIKREIQEEKTKIKA